MLDDDDDVGRRHCHCGRSIDLSVLSKEQEKERGYIRERGICSWRLIGLLCRHREPMMIV